MFAVLEFSDYAIIALIMLFVGCSSVSTIMAGVASRAFPWHYTIARLTRLERKIDAILQQLKIEYVDITSPEGLSAEVQALADDPAKKIEAIKVHRQFTGVSLKAAKDAVEAYMSRRIR